MGDRFAGLAPRDTAITLRSLRRRYKGAAALAREAENRHTAVGPSSSSLIDLANEAAQISAMIGNEIDRSLDHETPVVPSAAIEASERHFVGTTPLDLAAAIAEMADQAELAADRIERSTASQLSRPVSVVGGGSTTPLALGQEMARSLIRQLDTITTHVEWMIAS